MILKNGGPSDGATARSAITAAGGLCSIADLARRWGMSKQRARIIVRKDGFPEPVLTEGNGELWFADEADDFRVAQPAVRRPVWRCWWPRCPAWKQIVTPTDRGRCPHCGHTVAAEWPR